MYLYLALYYFVTVLSSTTSYVLLAANIDDFRTLAKEFLPDGLAQKILNVAEGEETNSTATETMINSVFLRTSGITRSSVAYDTEPTTKTTKHHYQYKQAVYSDKHGQLEDERDLLLDEHNKHDGLEDEPKEFANTRNKHMEKVIRPENDYENNVETIDEHKKSKAKDKKYVDKHIKIENQHEKHEELSDNHKESTVKYKKHLVPDDNNVKSAVRNKKEENYEGEQEMPIHKDNKPAHEHVKHDHKEIEDEHKKLAKKPLKHISKNVKPELKNEKPTDDYVQSLDKYVQYKHNKPIASHENSMHKHGEYIEKDEKPLKTSKKKSTTSKYELLFNDLVEKVKKRLYTELQLMAATADKTKATRNYKNIRTTRITINKHLALTKTSHQPRTIQSPRNKNTHSKDLKLFKDPLKNKHRDDHKLEIKHKHQTADADVDYTKKMHHQNYDKSPTLTTKSESAANGDTNHHKLDEIINTIRKTTTQHKRIKTTTENSDIINKHYPEISKHNVYKHSDNTQSREALRQDPDKKIYFDSVEEKDEKTTDKDFVNYEDETTNYNKRKRKDNNDVENKYMNDNNKRLTGHLRQPIQPYAELTREINFNNENSINKTEKKVKARSRYEYSFDGNPISKYISPNAGQINEIKKIKEYSSVLDHHKKKSMLLSATRGRKHVQETNFEPPNTPVIIDGRLVLI